MDWYFSMVAIWHGKIQIPNPHYKFNATDVEWWVRTCSGEIPRWTTGRSTSDVDDMYREIHAQVTFVHNRNQARI
jgi:hypothetical protein